MSSDLWIGTLVSIPVSIVAALVVPPIQRWLDKRGEKSHAKRRERIRDEYNEVLHYALRTDLLLGRMLVTLIQLAETIFVFVLWVWVRPILDDVFGLFPPRHLSVSDHLRSIIIICFTVFLSTMLAFMTVGAVMFIKSAVRWVNVFLNVKYVQTYIKSIPDDIRDKEIEKVVMYVARERALPTDALRRLCRELESKESQPPGEGAKQNDNQLASGN